MWPFDKKERPIHLGDRVWVSAKQKNEHLVSDALHLQQEGKWVIISYYFTDTGEFIKSLLKEKQVAFSEMDNVRPELNGNINLADAESLLTHYFLEHLRLGTKEVIILFAEHYPLFNKENKMLQSLDILGLKASYVFYNSFDDPLLTRFGADKLGEITKSLGLKEDEMIAHTIISSAIAKVQKKIESKVKFEVKAFSLEEWFRSNP